jgi:molybdopterin-containing oxidoreductase family iron-sulfur binding subunit
MSVERRKFLKIAGLTALGLAGGAPAKILSEDGTIVDSTELLGDTTSTPRGPLTAKRWAMVVDLAKCREQGDCDDCRKACHLVHNVPQFDNPKDEIKWIWKEKFDHAFGELEHEYLDEEVKHTQAVVLCNHCDNPPCVRVCPTQATWKREKDGIVMMDWHRCIGCRYCVVACPYGSRSFNWRDPRPHIKEIQKDFPTRARGVVEKCTFCETRLDRGEIPACVEACKARAMVFGDLEDPSSEVRKLLAERYSIRRKPTLGTQPEVYYLL